MITPEEFIERINGVIRRLGNSPSADPISMQHMSSCAGDLADLRDTLITEIRSGESIEPANPTTAK